jgi:type IV secretion system protein VirB11
MRIQVVFPPACESGTVAISIRKQTIMNLDLDQYEAIGAFQNTLVKHELNPVDKKLRDLLNAGAVKEFIKQAVLAKKNIIISGGTSTGKTTFFNATLKVIPATERVITCEDAREIMVPHLPNRVHLLASKGGQGRAKVTMQDLIEACLRLRPDRLMLGELRGAEAFSFLRAVNTGHPGSISTLHADTPELAIEQLILMVLQAGLGINREQIKAYVENVINVIIQLKRGPRGMRYVSELYFKEGL